MRGEGWATRIDVLIGLEISGVGDTRLGVVFEPVLAWIAVNCEIARLPLPNFVQMVKGGQIVKTLPFLADIYVK